MRSKKNKLVNKDRLIVNGFLESINYLCPVCEIGGHMEVDRRNAAHVLKCERCDSVFVLKVFFKMETEIIHLEKPWEGLMAKIRFWHKGRVFFHLDPSKYIGKLGG